MEYKGFTIAQEYDGNYSGSDPDADYDFEDERYIQCSGAETVYAGSIKGVEAAIDEYFEELAADICLEACGIACPAYMEYYGLELKQIERFRNFN